MRAWKVPFRDEWCSSFKQMAKMTVWHHVVVRLFPSAQYAPVSPTASQVLTAAVRAQTPEDPGPADVPFFQVECPGCMTMVTVHVGVSYQPALGVPKGKVTA